MSRNLPTHNRPLANIPCCTEVGVKGVAALCAAKRQTLPGSLIHAPALATGAGSVGGVNLDDFETYSFGLVAEDVKELSISPCTMVVASLSPSSSGPPPNTVK